jgi:hypothetical protein
VYFLVPLDSLPPPDVKYHLFPVNPHTLDLESEVPVSVKMPFKAVVTASSPLVSSVFPWFMKSRTARTKSKYDFLYLKLWCHSHSFRV